MDFLEKVLSAAADHGMAEKGDAVVAALSGGADSVSLLYALKELSGELGITVSACHVNHHLRGEESDSDMRFCEKLCEQLEGEGCAISRRTVSMCRFISARFVMTLICSFTGAILR